MKVRITNSENILQYWNAKLDFDVLALRRQTFDCQQVHINELEQNTYQCVIGITNTFTTALSQIKNVSQKNLVANIPSPLIDEIIESK